MRVHTLVMGAHTPVRPYDRAGMVHVRMMGAHTQVRPYDRAGMAM